MKLDRRGLFAAGAAGMGSALLGSPAQARIDPAERKPLGGNPFRLSVAAYSYRQLLAGANRSMDLFDFIRRCAEMGSDGVELTEYYFEKPVTPEYLLRLKRTAHLCGVSITGTPIGNVFTHPAGPERERQIETYRRWIQASATLGSPAIRTFAGSAPKGVSESDARRNAIETLEIVCEDAARHGVFVALENHGGVVATADGLLEIVKSVRSPWLGVNLDTGNFHTADPYADLARCAPHAVSVQYKVEMRRAGGAVEPADFSRIVRILRDVHYRGFITLEYEAREDPLAAVPRHLEAMRRVLQQP